MNTEKNKKIWLKKCETTLKLGGRSDITVRNYSYAIKRFLNSYDNSVRIKMCIRDRYLGDTENSNFSNK